MLSPLAYWVKGHLHYFHFRMSAALATGVMDFSSVLSKMVLFTMSQAWQLGRAVQRAINSHASVVETIAEQQNGIVLILGKV